MNERCPILSEVPQGTWSSLSTRTWSSTFRFRQWAGRALAFHRLRRCCWGVWIIVGYGEWSLLGWAPQLHPATAFCSHSSCPLSPRPSSLANALPSAPFSCARCGDYHSRATLALQLREYPHFLFAGGLGRNQNF